MTDFYIDVDAIETDDRSSLEPVPAGSYVVQIIESDVAATKSGGGLMLKVTLEVYEGPYANRKIWDNINFQNQNEVAQRIGQQAVKAICHAVGFGGALTNERLIELHGIPLRARVAIETDESSQYAPKNVVKRYSPAEVGQATAAPVPRQAAQAPRQAAPAARQAAPAAAATGRGAPAFMNRR